MSDEQLVKDCIQQRPTAQKQLFDRFSRKMLGLCLRYAADTQEAQDIMQDGFVKVFNSIGGFQHEGSLEGWIKRIMINTALDAYRKDKKRRYAVELDDEQAMEISDQDGIVEGINAEFLLKLIRKLPEGYQIVFNMSAIEGYSHKEIADQLGISVNTSKSQYSRARVYLQKMLSKTEASWTDER
jgi:RNA polymerase sigma-70 factor (ECF subfamily)